MMDGPRMPEWRIVRLELAGTPEFPEGSASRAYMLRLPLDEHGRIDDAALAREPAVATVRRFWPSEADLSGYVTRNGGGWAFSYALAQGGDETACHLELHSIRTGERVIVTEPDGRRLPFRVVRAEPDGLRAESGAGWRAAYSSALPASPSGTVK